MDKSLQQIIPRYNQIHECLDILINYHGCLCFLLHAMFRLLFN